MQRKITWKSMNILVCISKTPDTTSKVSFDGSGQHYIEDGVQFIMNPYDEWYALVRALELKEQFGGQVDVIHVGPATSEMIIRKALAIGADAAYRVDTVAKDAYFTACQISDFAKRKKITIFFLLEKKPLIIMDQRLDLLLLQCWIYHLCHILQN